MSLSVDVFHGDTHVATVKTVCAQPWKALEEAYLRTQNIMGSWSRGERFEDGTNNLDFHPNVTVHAPLPSYGGVLCGLRSSDVGDIFVCGGAKYRVASIGFNKIKEEG